MKKSFLSFSLAALACASGIVASACAQQAVVPLTPKGEQFVDASGAPVRFWGVNLVAFYPTHDVADKLARNLAKFEFNLVRPHHMLRPSRDWVTKSQITSLLQYKNNSRDWDDEAWDRFDYLNAALRKNGIYLQLALGWTRDYLPGDAAILDPGTDDAKAWAAAIDDLNDWPWQKSFDVRKMLPVFDRRAAMINEEFLRRMLEHRNPYSKLAYAEDPQVISYELINEFSSEYTIICQNKLPEYFLNELTAQWHAYAASQGVEGGNIYKPASQKIARVRADFFRKMDEDYLLRMKKIIRESGSQAAVSFSNLWRGDRMLGMLSRSADYVEDHEYNNPFVANGAEDFVLNKSRSAIAGKPLILGEFNQSEGEKKIKTESPYRSMLPLAAGAYGNFQNWSGIVWFAWQHGDSKIADDGMAQEIMRAANIGNLMSDGLMQDHLRTAGIMFRRGLVSPSVSPILLPVDSDKFAADYHGLMRGQAMPKAGWQSIHAIRKVFRTGATAPTDAPYLKDAPAGPLVSDTQQIIKDITRKQLTVAAPSAEAFSGMLDQSAPAGLKKLSVSGQGFATVIAVAADGRELSASGHIIISRTCNDETGADIAGPQVALSGLQIAGDSHAWQMRITRPKSADPIQIRITDGKLLLPDTSWNECEIELK